MDFTDLEIMAAMTAVVLQMKLMNPVRKAVAQVRIRVETLYRIVTALLMEIG